MTRGSRELVQIALPTYNGAQHIGEALSSLLAQSHAEIMLHVMDNASTDGTSDIVSDVARRDPRVIHHRSEEFVSATENWLRAFDTIDCDASRYFMWASDDDLWDRMFIEKLVCDLERDEETVLAFPQYRSIDEDDRAGALYYEMDFPARSRFRQISRLIQYGRFSAIYGVMRMSALNWRPILFEASFGSDRWFLMRLSSRGRFVFRREPLFYKRLGGISQTNSDQSASIDPDAVWTLGEGEKRMIMELSFSFVEKMYLYNLLRIQAKVFFPCKSAPRHISAWAALVRLANNHRALGIRKSMSAAIGLRQK